MRLRPSPATAARLLAPAVRALCWSWRFDVRGAEHWARSRRGDRPVVYLMWHDALLPLLWHHRGLGVAIVVSEARDGQYLADFATSLGYRTVRGSSRRGGVRALVGAVKVLESGGSVAFTPDGPTGPRRVLKPGFLAAAQKTGALVVPVHADSKFARRLRSWDRFLFPLPGARIAVVFGAPFEVAGGPAGLEDGRRRATEALEALVEEAAG